MANNRLRGFVGQTMGGRRSYQGALAEVISITDTQTGSGIVTATRNCWAFIYLTGGGATGTSAGAAVGGAGGGAAALFKKVRLSGGQRLVWSVGAGGADGDATTGFDGGDTTVTLPNGPPLVAGGGKKGITAGGLGGIGGIATGGDVNRNGGAGGNGDPGGTNGQPGASGGVGGGAGGTTDLASGGGGGAAGFGDFAASLLGGAGGAGSNGSGPGGLYGGGAGASSGAGAVLGGNGRVLIWLFRVS